MQPTEIIRQMVAYHVASQRRLWECVVQVDEAAFEREDDYSHGSMRKLMIHMAQTDIGWLMGLRGGGRQPRPGLENYPDRASVGALLERAAAEMTAFADALDDAGLEQVVEGMAGPVWQPLVHLVIHGVDHRAQVLRLLAAAGGPTFEQDFIWFAWNVGR
jgi:uncharacterized damage-inducible protein DinB